MKTLWTALACSTALAGTLAGGMLVADAQQPSGMTFFVTSTPIGDGANLGGLDGADAHCQELAVAVGAGEKTWHAYLSSSSVNARDRIGDGPWQNAKGEVIASNIDELHSDANKISKETALSEKGEVINGRGDEPNRHDILTGSNPDGTAADQTCDDWTANEAGAAIVGHHDRMGLDETAPAKSWNSSHETRGCSQDALRGTGGDGLLYCFASD
jgi:hypothetical protein